MNERSLDITPNWMILDVSVMPKEKNYKKIQQASN
jgi:hypothetical protein